MNRTTKRISYFVFLSIVSVAVPVYSMPLGSGIGILLNMSAVQAKAVQASSGVPSGKTASPKAAPEEVEGLLAAARKAMKQGKLKEAHAKILRAESAKVHYPMLHFGDTPGKARRDFEKLRRRNQANRKNNRSTKQSIATRLNPLAAFKGATTKGSNRTPAADPFVKQAGHIENGEMNNAPRPSASVELTVNNPFRPSPASKPSTGEKQSGAISSQITPSEISIAPSPQEFPATTEKGSRYSTGSSSLQQGSLQQNSLQQGYPSTSQSVPTPPVAGNLIPSSLPLRSDIQVAQALDSIPSPLPATEENLPGPYRPESGSLVPGSPVPDSTVQLLQEGEQALRQGNRQLALELFKQAYKNRGELDQKSQQQLQDHLQMLAMARPADSARSTSQGQASGRGQASGASLLGSVDNGQALLARQISADVGGHQSEAARLRNSNPNQSLVVLREAQDLVSRSELDEGIKSQLTRRIELSLEETEKYIHDHKGELELDEQNREVLADIERQRTVRVEVRERVAELVNQFNTLRDEQRYAEMEVVAKRLYDMAPEEPVAQQVWENAKFIRRSMLNRELRHDAEQGIYDGLVEVQKTAILRDPDNPYQFPKTWDELIKNRTAAGEKSGRLTPRELEIQRELRTPVMPRYDEMPLSQVIEGLSELTGVNIHLDPRGMSQEGVRSDTPITLDLNQEISLESALNLILEPLHLTYLIDDEVLKITSEQLRDGEVFTRAYNVADLVIPIPNFVPSSNMGLQGLINDAYGAMGYGAGGGGGGGGPLAMVTGGQPGQSGGVNGSTALAQQFGAPGSAGGGGVNTASGPGGMGGAANADFDSLIELITSTIESDSWMENGTGAGEIREYPNNLSIVVSQTQRIHEQIADLLEQLRRLQDLQVTIEVRFIRLTDSFFERIGIDFDFNIEDGSELTDLTPGAAFEPIRASASVGLNPSTSLTDFPNFTADLDIPFRQDSFGLATPQFGVPRDVATFGFAILSDIEAYFLINAAQGDSRANVLQAPKVTLFNGQQATVVDTAFVPFVISVIPVVGEFAAAQQPVIVVLSEGTMMTVQAVVSENRKYVRLTLVPFFSQIGNVQEFTFEGSETSTSASNTTDQDDDGNNENDDNSTNTIRSGTTVQLPTFEVISVSTTVSVPDGGTVLLGGIKRLREGRNEFGVPLLSKIPYIDRLFRNVGIGRETDSLMMMVTPHIIIQEEEEERLGIVSE